MSPTSEVEYPISPAPIPFRRGNVSAMPRSTADAASHLPEVGEHHLHRADRGHRD